MADQPATTRPGAISDFLHNQADQLAEAAARLNGQVDATRAEADQLEAQASHLRDRSAHLHDQADRIDRVYEAQP